MRDVSFPSLFRRRLFRRKFDVLVVGKSFGEAKKKNQVERRAKDERDDETMEFDRKKAPSVNLVSSLKSRESVKRHST